MKIKHTPKPVPAADNWTFDVTGDEMQPLYAHGDRIVVSRSAAIGIGDTVSALTRNGQLIAGSLIFRNNEVVIIGRGGWCGDLEKLELAGLKAFGRVVWASQ